GGPTQRDEAYHQGTVWPWLLGPDVEARRAAGQNTDGLLAGLTAHLREYGLGSVSETAEGDPPHAATGCPFQAWSVAELIRTPPVLVGGLGRHVHALATSLAAAGHEVTVVTRHAADAPLEELREGVRVVRAPEDPPSFPLATRSLLAWTMAFNHALTRAALHATASEGYDLIHAHDWLVTHTAVTLRDHLRIPLVATVHATEAGRHQGWLPE